MVVPSSSPSASEHCWWVHVSSNACRSPSTFATATWRSPTPNAVTSPSGTSPAEPPFTHSPMNPLLLRAGSPPPGAATRPERLCRSLPYPPSHSSTPAREDVRGQVPDDRDQVQRRQDQEAVAEVDRRERRDQRAADPRELEQDLVPDEQPAVRTDRREWLHQRLEREPPELGGRPHDGGEQHEHHELEREERERRAHPGADQAADHDGLLAQVRREPGHDQVSQVRPRRGRTREDGEPPRRLAAAPEREREREQQEPARGAQPRCADRRRGELRARPEPGARGLPPPTPR